jgi:hypothetical protein
VEEAAAPPPPADDIDRRLDREGGQRGELNVTLVWDNRSDLDLEVVCPGGARINFRQPRNCGGRLDVDANVRGQSLTDRPVENVFFAGDPPAGTYELVVTLFRAAPGSPRSHPFSVRVQVGGRTQTLNGTVSPSRPVWRRSFTVQG